jgi:hypothetical protein
VRLCAPARRFAFQRSEEQIQDFKAVLNRSSGLQVNRNTTRA